MTCRLKCRSPRLGEQVHKYRSIPTSSPDTEDDLGLRDRVIRLRRALLSHLSCRSQFETEIPYVERPLRVQRFAATLGTRETVLPGRPH